jgi:hypothetical protein
MPYTLETAAQAALDAAYDRALEDAAVKAQHVLADVRCAKCNAPRNNHPYRHPFQPSESVDVPAALRAKAGDYPGSPAP